MNAPLPGLDFVKMEGAGNDYVYVDACRQPWFLPLASQCAEQLADRHFGVGGDGLIVMAPAASPGADVSMHMFNADGSRGSMCGNGLRCLAKLAIDHGHVRNDAFAVETDAGRRQVTVLRDLAGAVTGARVRIGPVALEPEPLPLQLDGVARQAVLADVGNPHAVVLLDADPETVPVERWGPAVQALPRFAAAGVNVEFVQARADGALRQRTWERGTGETLACGSGAVAAAAVALVRDAVPGPSVDVHLRGGVLTVVQLDDGLVLQGPARTVFRGRWSADVPQRR